MSARLVVVAGVASGVGKTMVTLGLIAAYRRRGLVVQPFKVGPDFIDPGFHERVSGRPSYNLDGWMCGRQRVLETVARHGRDADLVIVEGVMGCFDGADAASEAGSTAEVAKWLDAPVVLVLDASRQARSAAAVVMGFERFDPGLRVAGVIANRVAGARHAHWVEEAIARRCRTPVVGAIPTDDALAMPERHLGLVTAVETALGEQRRARLAGVIEGAVDLGRVLELAGEGGVASRVDTPATVPARTDAGPRVAKAPRTRIGVARDAAFQFYYAENLDRLRAAGAELVFWSPLRDPWLPDVDGLYLGGGYPELHAPRLSANVALRDAIRDFAAADRPIYAECGGLMYLAESLEDMDGVPHAMVGLLPARVRMQPRRMTLGYTEVELTRDTPLGRAGAVGRGHAFHWSTLDPVPASVERVYRATRRGDPVGAEGYLVGRTLLSYVHLHFASNPELADGFVDACAGSRRAEA